MIGKIAMQIHAAQQKAGAGKAVGPITPAHIKLAANGEAKLELQKAIEAAEADSADDIDDSRVDRKTQEAVKRYFEVMKKEVAAEPEKK